jgi:hypothetical protein
VDGDSFAADMVHTYTVCRLTLQMVLDDFNFLGLGNTFQWAWQKKCNGSGSLRIITHGKESFEPASYNRGKKLLRFNFITIQEGRQYSCRCQDVVSHEVGHAILDGINPLLYERKGDVCACAFHEAFADGMSMFYRFCKVEWCETFLSACGGDLKKSTSLTKLGVHLGALLQPQYLREDPLQCANDGGEHFPVRDFTNQTNAMTCRKGPYALGSVLVGWWWDIVVRMTLTMSSVDGVSSLTLFQQCTRVRRLVLRATVSMSRRQGALDFNVLLEEMLNSEVVAAVCRDDHVVRELLKHAIAETAAYRQIAMLGQSLPSMRHRMLGNW